MHSKIYQEINQRLGQNQACWLATVVSACGSTPARIGMKMLLDANGIVSGTIGGGAIEKAVLDRVIQEHPDSATKWSYDLDGNSAYEATGMICGGTQEILIEPLGTATPLYILGGGHCGQALAELAARCDFHVTVIDDRPEIADVKRLPFAAEVICAPYADIEQHLKFSPKVFIVAMTHGHKHDHLLMEKILPHKYLYFGVIGSKKKVSTCFEKLVQSGFSEEQLRTIYSPIGFAIGSQTPLEVAVSILAQLIAVKNGKHKLKFNSNVLAA